MNQVLPFSLYNTEIKGRAIRLDESLNLILSQHNYPEEISRILAELLLVSALLGSQFKDDVSLTIQLQSDAKIKIIVAEYRSPGFIRGYAQYDPDKEFSAQGILGITINHGGNDYQGIVEVKNLDISKAMEDYFAQSEQIKTSIKLTAWNINNSWIAGGIMMQKLPSDNDSTWDEANIYFSTLKNSELVNPNLSLKQLIYSLYHEVGVTAYEPIDISHKCKCSRLRAEEIIHSLGYKQAKDLAIDGEISVCCQFCNISQNFNSEESEKIFKN